MEFDLVIKNGTVVFGNLQEKKIINIGISNEKIVMITSDTIKGKEEIDVRGKIVAPGFIDPHTHSDLSAFFQGNMTSKLEQGVTTEINGNCGVGIYPYDKSNWKNHKSFVEEHFSIPKEDFSLEEIQNLSALKKFWNKKKFLINQGYLVATGCLRIAVAGFSTDKLNDKELKKMLELLEEELKNGSYGVSFGLIYQPGNFMDKEEIIEILKVVSKYEKVASFHIRNEGFKVIESIKEVVYCAKASNCKVNISHLKIMDKNLWGKSEEILEIINKAVKEGVKITFDQYPYIATSTTMMVLIPDYLFSGDIEKFIEKFPLNTEDKTSILEIINNRGGVENILISNSFMKDNKYSGKLLSEIVKETQKDPVEIILEIIKISHGRARAIYFSMDQEDMFTFMKSPLGVVGSDGSSISTTYDEQFGLPHPRNFATFPNFIEINKEKDFFSMEEMINKMTYKTAQIFSIKDRGLIKEGYFADIVIFDYEKIKGASKYENPFIKTEGIHYVIVNGKIALENGKVRDAVRNGKFI